MLFLTCRLECRKQFVQSHHFLLNSEIGTGCFVQLSLFPTPLARPLVPVSAILSLLVSHLLRFERLQTDKSTNKDPRIRQNETEIVFIHLLVLPCSCNTYSRVFSISRSVSLVFDPIFVPSSLGSMGDLHLSLSILMASSSATLTRDN